MKKVYEEPKMEWILLAPVDVICTSQPELEPGELPVG